MLKPLNNQKNYFFSSDMNDKNLAKGLIVRGFYEL